MIVKANKSTYNIKLLKGYGISIKQKNSQIHLTDGVDSFNGEKTVRILPYVHDFPYVCML